MKFQNLDELYTYLRDKLTLSFPNRKRMLEASGLFGRRLL